MEAAYRRRFASRRDAETRLEELAAHLDPHLAGKARRVWVVVTAVCSVPAPYDTAPTVDARSAAPGMTEIFRTLAESEDASCLRHRLTQLAPRVGLRRTVFTESRPYTGQCDRA
ncbi:hypothetical protein ACFWNK_28275 [Streptomyces sp. NPDC058417]|uniref:hypothetical protein n=1 Tax=unclassified Streptomyces TaxID=2593676 RepID=UPI003661386E